jgi:chaperonin cofactor prefoldin
MPEVADLFTPALILALFAWLRSDIRKLSDRLDATTKTLNERLDAVNARFDTVLREIADLRERMAKMEGSLEGFLAGRRDRDAA